MAARRKTIDDDFRDEDEDAARGNDADDPGQRLWPDWPGADCADPCTALNLGRCCKYPADPLIRRAAEVADAVHRTLSRAGQGECALMAAQTSRLLLSVYGLLAQMHAVLPNVSRATAAQLLCPVGRLAGAVDAIRAQGCPWACGDPAVPDRRPDFAPLGVLLEECSAALRAILDQPR